MNKPVKIFVIILAIFSYSLYVFKSGLINVFEVEGELDITSSELSEEFSLPGKIEFTKLDDSFSPIIHLEASFIRTMSEDVEVGVTSNETLKTGDFGYYTLETRMDGSYAYVLNITDFENGENFLDFSFTDQNGNETKKNLWIEKKQVLGIATDGSETLWLDGDDLLTVIDQRYSLPSGYYPSDLVFISEYEIPAVYGKFLLRQVLIDDLTGMISDAKAEDCNLIVMSAYRSFYKQGTVFSQRVAAVGYDEAIEQAAKAGHSEHQLGTAIDFTNLERTKSATFGDTKEGQWLAKNAHKYGFVLSYPEDSQEITGYQYESWHYRYVGREAAKEIYKSGKIPIEYLKSVNGI